MSSKIAPVVMHWRKVADFLEMYRSCIDLILDLMQDVPESEATEPNTKANLGKQLAERLFSFARSQIQEIPLKDIELTACSPQLLKLCVLILEYRRQQAALESIRSQEMAHHHSQAHFPWIKLTPVSSLPTTATGFPPDEPHALRGLPQLIEEIQRTSEMPSDYLIEHLPRTPPPNRHPSIIFATIPRVAQLVIKISDPERVRAIEQARIDRITVLGIDEADSEDPNKVWMESKYHVFRRITQHAYELVSFYSNNKPLKRLLMWFANYRSLFVDKCRVCGHCLAFDSASAGFLPPAVRGFQKMSDPYHSSCIQTEDHQPLPACRQSALERRETARRRQAQLQERQKQQWQRQQMQQQQQAQNLQIAHQTQLLSQLQKQQLS